MKIVFWHSDKPRERLLASAFIDGAKRFGDTVEARALTPEAEADFLDCDVACMVGVKSRERYRNHVRSGVHVLYFDKGYTRHAAPGDVKLWQYWRIALDAHHPTERLSSKPLRDDRLDQLGIIPAAWRKHGKHIVLAGSSAKYHEFYRLHPPTQWAREVVEELRAVSTREIVYRPKPSWSDAVPVPGTRYSTNEESIEQVLKDAHVLVTHGSNACFEAILYGIPCIVLGDAVARPISDTAITAETVENPRQATYAERYQWLANLAYWQWTMPEIAGGKMWEFVRPQIYG